MTVMDYTLKRSKRKTIAIHIKPNGAVEVRAPLRLSQSAIASFIASKSPWIERKLAEIAAKPHVEPQALPPSPYAKGAFERAISDLVRTWEQRLGVETAFVGVRQMTSRWGSCTAKTRRIRLNAALAYCPRACLEYVIVHELAHLRENNHSRHFWAVVAAALPDYKARQDQLKALSWLLGAAKDSER